MTEDITAEVNARKQLEEAEEKFRMIADNISQLAWMADETGSIFWYNKRWYDYTATTLDEMKGWGWQKVHHPDHLERVVKKVTRHFETGEIWEDVFPLKSKDGEYRWFLSRAIPTKNKQGQVISWFGTNTDITEQRKQEERKDDFLSIASHELKTPITSLKAGLQLLNVIKEKPNSPMHIKLIEQCNRSMDRMGALIDDLLNVNRMATGQLQLYITTFTIADLLRTSCTDVRIAAKHKLIVQGEKNLIVAADEHRIEQVVVNFVNNAVKYAPGSEEIFLIVEKIGDHAKISVKDSGPGIAKEKLSFLFDRYYRVDHSGQTYTGLGLGLYISAEIIKRHGGQIGVESELGKGSAFWFTLPL
jgi:two-component system sensor histidine kinase VicK